MTGHCGSVHHVYECVVGLICSIVGVCVSIFKRNTETRGHIGNCSVTEKIKEERK